jgi:protein-disulfide isomerase
MGKRSAIVLSIGFVAALSSSVGLSAPLSFAPVDQLHHIHGLAVDPHDPSIVYIATHGGLVRLVEGKRWEHVGEGRSDLMGFTIHPSERGVMFVSGHPDHSSHLPNPIGVMISKDAGQTWQPVALAGKVDLHAMTIGADGQTLYGWNVTGSPGLYQVSVNKGTWAKADAKGLQDVFSLAAHPKRSNTLLAGTRGGLAISHDEGRTWSPITEALSGVPVTAVAYHPKNHQVVYAYAVRPDLGLIRSDDEGHHWKTLRFFLGEKDAVNVFAISPHRPEIIYASSFASDLYQSKDGGERWQPLAKRGRPAESGDAGTRSITRDEIVALFAKGPSRGSEEAPITIVELGDFQCFYCGKFWKETLPRIQETYVKRGKVRFVYRHFAILGEHSLAAAQAAECATEQGKFWEYHDRLFASQGPLAFTKENLKRYAKELGLDTAPFKQCLDSDKYAQKVEGETGAGKMLGLRGTPAFFINGRLLVGAHPFENFQAIIEEELKTAKPTTDPPRR